MRINKSKARAAIMYAVLETCTIKELANTIVETLNDKSNKSAELQSVKGAGFSIRKIKETDVTDNKIAAAIQSSVINIVDQNLCDIADYLADNYSIPYDSDYVDDKFVEELFDFNHSGRLVHVEVDA